MVRTLYIYMNLFNINHVYGFLTIEDVGQVFWRRKMTYFDSLLNTIKLLLYCWIQLTVTGLAFICGKVEIIHYMCTRVYCVFNHVCRHMYTWTYFYMHILANFESCIWIRIKATGIVRLTLPWSCHLLVFNHILIMTKMTKKPGKIQMQDCMLLSSNVQIYRHPVISQIFIKRPSRKKTDWIKK